MLNQFIFYPINSSTNLSIYFLFVVQNSIEMHPILRNILAVVIGLIIGSAVNMGLIYSLDMLVPPPPGFDRTDMDTMRATFHLLETKHLLMPFIAHAMGTLVGAFIAVKIGVSRHVALAMIIAMLFLLGGTAMVIGLPSPMWFTCLDLGVAYFPMAWLGFILAGSGR